MAELAPDDVVLGCDADSSAAVLAAVVLGVLALDWSPTDDELPEIVLNLAADDELACVPAE